MPWVRWWSPGSEKAFAAGADIKEMLARDFADACATDFIAAWQNIAEHRKPVIAAVAGYALGGGCELAMMCDLILAADNAKFGQPEINLGTIPGAGGTQRLTRAVGKSKAMELVLTGRMMDAVEAERSGLVARVVPVAELLDEALKLGETIAAKSRAGRRHGQGRREHGLRDHAGRGDQGRAAAVLRHLRHRRSARGHERLRRQAQPDLHPPVRRRALTAASRGAIGRARTFHERS